MKNTFARVLVGVAAVSLTLAACGQADEAEQGATATGGSPNDGPSSGDSIQLRVVWWGSEDRGERTVKALELFEEKHPGLEILTESMPFDGYLEKLATQTAGGGFPDVVQLPVEAVLDYGGRELLADLSSIDASKLEVTTTNAARLGEVQLGLPTGVATGAVLANKTLFDQAGVPLPDDKTWTWADYQNIAVQLSEKLPDGIYGSGGLTDYTAFGAVLRQQGEGKGLHGFDEPILFNPEDISAFFQLSLDLMESGAAPEATRIIEDMSVSVEQGTMAQNKVAMGLYPTSLYTAINAVSTQEIVALRYPSWPTDPGNPQMALGASQFWGASAKSEHADLALELVDFLVNSTEAGGELLVSRGTPPNSEVRESILGALDPAEAAITQFFDEIVDEMVAVPLPPAGSSQFQQISQRHLESVLFKTSTVEEAGEAMYRDVLAEIN